MSASGNLDKEKATLRLHQPMSPLCSAEDQLTGLRGRVDDAGSKTRALEEQIAEKLRSYRED